MTTEHKTTPRNISFRIEDDLREDLERTLNELGLNFTAAFTMFAKAVVRTGAIPFDLVVDPFYKKENQDEIKRRISLLETGETKGLQVVKSFEELEAISDGD